MSASFIAVINSLSTQQIVLKLLTSFDIFKSTKFYFTVKNYKRKSNSDPYTLIQYSGKALKGDFFHIE